MVLTKDQQLTLEVFNGIPPHSCYSSRSKARFNNPVIKELLDNRLMFVEQVAELTNDQFDAFIKYLEVPLIKESIDNKFTGVGILAYYLKQEDYDLIVLRLQDPETADLVRNGSLPIVVKEYFGWGYNDNRDHSYVALSNANNETLIKCKKFMESGEKPIGHSILEYVVSDNLGDLEEVDALGVVAEGVEQ